MPASFRGRLLLLLVSLVAVAVLATMVAALGAAKRTALRSAEQDLHTGGLIFGQLLRSRGEQLSSSVRVLADDFGFKDAVTDGDLATIETALANHGARIGADAVTLVSLDGQILATTIYGADQPAQFPFPGLFESATRDGTLTSIVLLEGEPYQIVMVPVRAPVPVAWTSMGFRIDDLLAQELKSLTGLEVSFVGSSRNRPLPRYFASTLPSDDRPSLSRFSSSTRAWSTLEQVIVQEDDARISALLQIPMARVLETYHELRSQLILIAVLGLGLSLCGAVLLARQFSRPVKSLAAAAQRIERGDYVESVTVHDKGELGLLARALNSMQSGIAEREARIIYQAEHDALTGLPNRASLHDRLRLIMNRADQDGKSCAVLMLDINRFKEINDTLGHDVGDEVIKAVAIHLRSHLRETDTVVRLGGDEFLIILACADEAQAQHVASELVDSLGDAISVSGLQVGVRLSAGIALYPQHAADGSRLLRRADIAMYAARETECGIAVYVEGEDERHLRRVEIINALQSAIAGDALELHYQPKADLRDGGVCQVEALTRWEHPELGRMRPDEFIPLAEQSGNIKGLTRWVLRRAILQIREWRDGGLDLQVSVNLSALDLLDRQLPEIILSMLSEHRVPPASLILEVTESAVMRDTVHALAVLERLRSNGIRISIDDFGTGQSSLAQLKRLPVFELKIDKSFVMNMRQDASDAVICRSTIDLGHHMGLKVIAEGVEDGETLELLAEYGCDMAQGYGICRPLPAPALQQWLKARGRPSAQAAPGGETARLAHLTV